MRVLRLSTLLSALCMTMPFSSNAHAAGGVSTELLSASIQDLLGIELKGSTLTAKTRKHTPAAITVFTRQEIETLGVSVLEDLYAYVPGFQSYRSAERGMHHYTTIRGRRVGGAGNVDYLVLIDGIRITEGGNDGSGVIMPQISMHNVETIEFIRGPNSSVYGSNAMMGVINIITVDNANAMTAEVGELGHQGLKIMASNGSDEGLGVNVFGQSIQQDGALYTVNAVDGSALNYRDPYTNQDLNLEFTYKHSSLRWIHTTRESSEFYTLHRSPDDRNYSEGNFDAISYQDHFHLQETSFDTNVYYNKTQLLIDRAGAPVSQRTADRSDLNSTEAGAYIRANTPFTEHVSFQYGLEYRRSSVTDATFRLNTEDPNTQIISARTINLVERDSSNIYSGFAQIQASLSPQFDFNAGARFDKTEEREGHLSPRASLLYYPSDSSSIKLIYGSAFRNPAFAELGLSNNPFVSGNPDLKAETVESYDIIWETQFNKAMVSMAYFENHYSNAIALIDVNAGPSRYENIAQHPSKGYEIESVYMGSESFSVRTALTYLDEKTASAVRAANTIASFAARHTLEPFVSSIMIEYHSSRTLVSATAPGGRLELPSYVLANAKFTLSMPLQSDVSVILRNLSNTQVETPTQSTNFSQGVPNPGRQLILSFSKEFG